MTHICLEELDNSQLMSIYLRTIFNDNHYNDVTWALWHLKSLAIWLSHYLFRITSKKISKLGITGPLWGESIGGDMKTVDSRHKGPGGRFKNTYELLNLRALKFSYVKKIHIFQCMGKIFCVEFQRYPLKFHTKYLTHTLKDMIFMRFWNFKSS